MITLADGVALSQFYRDSLMLAADKTNHRNDVFFAHLVTINFHIFPVVFLQIRSALKLISQTRHDWSRSHRRNLYKMIQSIGELISIV